MAKRTRKSPAPSERDAPATAPPKRTRTPKAPKAAAASAEPGAPTPPAPKPAPPPKPGKPSALIDTRVVYCGDCLEQLRKLPDGCVDLVYIDPPFNSNRNYEVFWGETKEKRSFEDRHASTQAYIDYMRPRCVELARVLKKTGSFYYHCDWHAGHYVKVMLDQVFGEGCFQNMIVWKRSHAHSDTKQGMTQYGRICDYLFFYTRGKKWTWNPIHTAYESSYLESEYRHVDEQGRRYKETDVTAAKPGGDTSYDWRVKRSRRPGAEWIPDLDEEWKRPLNDTEYKGVAPYDKRYWAYSKTNLIAFWNEGRLAHRSTGMPRLMQFAEDMPGVPLQDMWTDIPPISALAAERLGYPTQKPLALLERIINASSNPNDIVLDAFCGCGTALVAAQNLGRQWVGIDISPTACRVMAKRLKDVCKMKESEPLWLARRADAFLVRDLPWTIEKLRQIPPFEFENWAVIAMGGIPNTVQVGDMGIDGRIFPVGTKPDDQH
ncbi:MAG: site-specific DNA-methyltransferase, partial [Phycisphaeraceae bacterium]|nr:site-specific DNA-methyltransferase [Phycisphaeraceae bacterium]